MKTRRKYSRTFLEKLCLFVNLVVVPLFLINMPPRHKPYHLRVRDLDEWLVHATPKFSPRPNFVKHNNLHDYAPQMSFRSTFEIVFDSQKIERIMRR